MAAVLISPNAALDCRVFDSLGTTIVQAEALNRWASSASKSDAGEDLPRYKGSVLLAVLVGASASSPRPAQRANIADSMSEGGCPRLQVHPFLSLPLHLRIPLFRTEARL